VLQCVRCVALQRAACVAVCCNGEVSVCVRWESVPQTTTQGAKKEATVDVLFLAVCHNAWQCVAAFCSVLQCVALQRVTVRCCMLHCANMCVRSPRISATKRYRRCQNRSYCGCLIFGQHAAICCSVLQCVAVYCSVLQCVAVCCSVFRCVEVFSSFEDVVWCSVHCTIHIIPL